jgi:hypothetical protein
MELNELLSDLRAIRDGVWVKVDPALFGDLEIKSRGHSDEFIDAQAAMSRKARLDLGLNADDPLPNATQRQINADLLRKFLVLDVRNLTRGGEPVAVEEFHGMLSQENAVRLSRACWLAAAKASSRTMKLEEADTGNS